MGVGNIGRELTGIKAVVLKYWCLTLHVWNNSKKVGIYNKGGEPKRGKLMGTERTWSMREI